jgi:hypothetical protein
VSLTKSEIATAVEAIRSLSDLIERLEKATWPETQNDVLRKADLLDHSDDAITKRGLDALADLERRTARIEAQRDMDSQHATRKTVTYEIRGQS